MIVSVSRENNNPRVVFATDLYIVRKGNTFEMCPKVVALPGDICIVQGELLQNLTQQASQDNRIMHSIENLVFENRKAS